MLNLQDEIRSKIDAFATELTALVRAAALEAVRASLDAPLAPATPMAPVSVPSRAAKPMARPVPKRTPARRKKAAPAGPPATVPVNAPVPAKAPAPAQALPAAKTVAGRVVRKGQKRDPKDLAALVERLFDFIKANPGRRVEQIKVALGLKTSALTLPIRKLIAAKRITATGLRRATTYSPT
jgi:hypothetical protein